MSARMPNPDELRARYWELSDAAAALAEELAPLHARREAVAADLDRLRAENLKPLNDELRAAEEPLRLVRQEMAAIARALKFKVGERPE